MKNKVYKRTTDFKKKASSLTTGNLFTLRFRNNTKVVFMVLGNFQYGNPYPEYIGSTDYYRVVVMGATGTLKKVSKYETTEDYRAMMSRLYNNAFLYENFCLKGVRDRLEIIKDGIIYSLDENKN